MRIPITLGSTTFSSKEQAKKKIREILNKPINTTLEGTDLEIMTHLLQRHPHYERKKGVGINKIFISNSPPGTPGYNHCFYILRNDNTTTDFSYLECLEPKDHKQNVILAMRKEISQEIMNFQKQHGGEHIDHVIPFSVLADCFLIAANKNYQDIELIGGEDNTTGYRLKDSEMAERWQKFHSIIAVLRPLSAQENSSRQNDKWKEEIINAMKKGEEKVEGSKHTSEA